MNEFGFGAESMAARRLGALEPFYIETPQARLFACYHEAGHWPARSVGIVCCQPQGQEYIRSHRAIERLAEQLAAEGFPVLRFDYSGTGDSSGEDRDGNLDSWRTEIAAASDALIQRSGVSAIALVGLRLGATLALEYAAASPEAPAALVLWEPVTEGASYLTEQLKRYRDTLFRYAIAPAAVTPPAHASAAGSMDVNGVELSEVMLQQLRALTLAAAQVRPQMPVLVIESGGDAEVARLAARLQGQSSQVTHTRMESFVVWTEDVDKGLVPQKVLSEIIGWLNTKFPP